MFDLLWFALELETQKKQRVEIEREVDPDLDFLPLPQSVRSALPILGLPAPLAHVMALEESAGITSKLLLFELLGASVAE